MVTPCWPMALSTTTVWVLAAHLVANGNDGLVVNGTTGEAPRRPTMRSVGS